MKVKAEGAGYDAIYTARWSDGGWCFQQQDGTFLTPGIGYPMYYPSAASLLQHVQATCKAKITVLEQ